MNNPLHQHIDSELLVRFLSGEASTREQDMVNQWIEADKENRKYFEELSAIWNASLSSGDFDTAYLTEDWNRVQRKIENATLKQSPKQGRQRTFVTQLARMAAVFIFFIGFYFLIQNIYRHWPTKEVIATSGIENVTLNLPDGTTVYLNANSTLTYPEKFDTHAREVTLEGEAFFEVAKNKQKPFRIKTGPVFTEVVGTSFNINSKTNRVVVTVLTGKVLLYKNRSDAIVMTVGEQGIYTGKRLERKLNHDPNFMSWKTNVLVFQNTSLTKVIDDLNRHYRQPIQIASNALEGCTLTSTFKDQTLEEILNELTVVFSIQLEKKGDTIIIKGKGC